MSILSKASNRQATGRRSGRLFRALGVGSAVALAIWAGLFGAASARQPADSEPSMQDHEQTLKNPDGSWKYTNRLIDSSSQYLLQHAHNPVDWRPWGPDAFEEAKKTHKPIFVSIGYSTCYWCHVMERQVFENPKIAEQMNEWFVCVKVDREQRPDVDEVYMAATQLFTQGHGGWPSNLFLTPELLPFYGGTFFGPEDSQGRPGFPRVLAAIHDAWTNQREAVQESAKQATERIRAMLAGQLDEAAQAPIDASLVEAAVESLRQSFDEQRGGWGLAPKFPNEANDAFLFERFKRTGDQKLLKMGLATLEAMSLGGIHDQVGGGFHRYSTDARWLVPHFEKMLYNQAQLVDVYLDGYELTGDPLLRRVVERALGFVDRVMTDPMGGFYSALDAESEATEGKSYLWTRQEIEHALGVEDSAFFFDVFALEPTPAIPGHRHADGGVVHWKNSVNETMERLGIEQDALFARLDPLLDRLLIVRDKREPPLLDTKVITAWNGMMIGAFARASVVLDQRRWLDQAIAAATFAMTSLRKPDGSLWRIWREGKTEIGAFQEDYAFMAQGLLSLHRATGDRQWLDDAVELMRIADERFLDKKRGGYYASAPDEHLIARSRSAQEGAIPSGNSVAAHDLIDLYELTHDEAYLQRADKIFTAYSGVMRQSPRGYTHMIHAVDRRLAISANEIDVTKLPADFIDRKGPAASEPVTAATDSALHVKATVKASTTAVAPGATFKVALVLEVDKGWHINANPASLDYLIPAMMDVRSEAPIEVVHIEYPPGEMKTLAFSDDPVALYEGRTTIIATLRVSPDWRPEPGATSVTLRVVHQEQACDDASCMAPSESVITIELPIARPDQSPKQVNSALFGDGAESTE